MDLLGPPAQLLLRLLSSTQERARVVAGNIANQNTPGYKRREHRFEELLANEMDKSHPNLTGIHAETVVDELSPARGDGNNVVLEDELGAIQESVLRYDLYAAMLRGRAAIVSSAIHGERQ